MSLTLYGSKQTGSLIVELALSLSGKKYKTTDIDYARVASGKARELKKLNPLIRVPTLAITPHQIITESGAMMLWIAAHAPRARLAPGSKSPDYARFLHLLFLITGEIYPCFTFGDDPSEWVRAPSARAPYAKNVLKHHQELWRYAETLVSQSGPWALGRSFSAIDLYLGVMTRWRPRQAWFAENTPTIAAIGARVRKQKNLKTVFERHGVAEADG